MGYTFGCVGGNLGWEEIVISWIFFSFLVSILGIIVIAKNKYKKAVSTNITTEVFRDRTKDRELLDILYILPPGIYGNFFNRRK